MEEYRCEFEGCSNIGEFRLDDVGCLCSEHLEQHRGQTSEKEWRERFYRRIIFEDQSNISEFIASNAFSSNYLFWVENQLCGIPPGIIDMLENLSKTFVNQIFAVGNGKPEMLRKVCNHYFYSLVHMVFNIQIDTLTLFNNVERVYNNYHSEKQSIILNLIGAELDKVENYLNMPKKATKLFISYDLDVVKQEFISAYFIKDSIDFKELHKDFCSKFSPFVKESPRESIFDNLESNFNVEINRLNFNTRNEFLSIANNVWTNLNYQTTSIFTKKVCERGEIMNIGNSSIKISSLFLTESVPVLESVVSLSKNSLILVLNINEDSYLLYYSNKKSWLVKIFPRTKIICAEGSDENFMLIFVADQRICEIYNTVENNIHLVDQFNLQLEENETVEDLVFIQGARSKVVFSSNIRGISLVHRNSLRTFINLNQEVSEFNWQLKFYKGKEVIILKSSKKIRVFSEFLEKIGEFNLESDRMTYSICDERVLRVLLQRQNELHEVSLNVNLNYSEPWRAREGNENPPICSHFAIKSVTDRILKDVGKEYSQLIVREFLIGN